MVPAAYLLALAATVAPQESADSTPVAQPLFESHEIVDFRIATDLQTLIRDIGKDRGDYQFEGEEEHRATLSYVDAAGNTVTLQVTAETRGHFRRSRKNCNFPPLRLDFDKPEFDEGQLDGTLFENQNKLKLVAHCQDKRDEYEQFVLQEYLIYRTYDLLSDMSFRVRLVRMTYVDTAGKRDSLTKYAFFLEDEDLMAARNGGPLLRQQGIHPLDLEYGAGTLVAVFQYMMLSTDWSVSGLHNIELIGPVQGMVYPVPFDFDWAGIIATPYAKPDPQLRLRSVRDRWYVGYCRSEADLSQAFQVFNGQQQAIYELHRNQEGLEERKLKRMLEDYDKFYNVISRPQEVQRTILRQCIKR